MNKDLFQKKFINSAAKLGSYPETPEPLGMLSTTEKRFPEECKSLIEIIKYLTVI